VVSAVVVMPVLVRCRAWIIVRPSLELSGSSGRQPAPGG
jgi:hypothetical protein